MRKLQEWRALLNARYSRNTGATALQ